MTTTLRISRFIAVATILVLVPSRPIMIRAQAPVVEPGESTPSEPAAPVPGDTSEKKEQDTEPAEADADGAPRSLVLPDNGELRRKLEKVRAQIAGENYADAARELGRFLQEPEIHDFFLNRDDQRRGGHGFLAEVRLMLRELPPAGQSAYRMQFEALARGRLNAAISRGDEASLREVAARFPETKSGDDALFRLAVYLRDHGRARAAVACLRQLRIRPEFLADDERWTAFLDKFAPFEAAHPIAAGDWMTFRGNAARNGSVPAQAPFLAARWSRPATADSSAQIAIDRVWQWYREGNSVSLPMLGPLAAGGLVFARTPRGVTAHDFETGQIRWSSPSDDDGDNAGLEQILWNEPAGGAFAVDEECVYLLDEVKIGESDAGIGSGSRLVAREHWRSREGNLRWHVGGNDGGAEPRLAGAFFLGPPLSWQGSLYVLAEAKGALSLFVLDRASGRLAWSQELALVEQDISQDLLRRIAGATPSISADEIIVCPTSGGAVVAVDLTTQSLLWAYRYSRETSQPESVNEFETAQQVDQSNRWLDATVLICGGRVIAAPPESQQIHCLDLKSGRPIWTAERDNGLFVACVTDERVVVVGRQEIRALKPENGERDWTLELPGRKAPVDRPVDRTADRSVALTASIQTAGPFPALPAGRGVFADGRYFLPVTSAAVLEIDLASGTLVAEHKSPRELSPGNLIWHKGRFISHGPGALEVFDEKERLSTEVDARLTAEPRDATALIRQGEIELSAGRLPEAIAAFRAAHESTPTPRTKSRLISALVDAVRQGLVGSDKFSDELDSLIGP
jgi:outer membrane protein assembly factor BamB